MKDLFIGSLGKLNNHGGSKIYTTPNTILVPPEYEIDVGEHGDFISCSLDGRLWLFEDRIIALKWNATTGKMEYATSKSFSDETFIARGRDWILTDKSIIQILNKDPYIQHKNIEHKINSVRHFYSLLPNIENWYIIENNLISSNEGTFSLTSLEIDYYSNKNIEVHTGINPYLTYFNNEIWGRGNSHIGKVYLLPKTFHKNGEIVDFYLYISPDYLRNYNNGFDNNDGWNNMGIISLDKNSLCGFKPKQNNEGLCIASEDTNIYLPATKEWINLSENGGNIFFDVFNNNGLILENDKIKLLSSEKSIEAKGISQWIAPVKQIENISDNKIISSSENQVLITHLDKGLYREILSKKKLPLINISYTKNDNSNIRLSLDENKKNIKVNTTYSKYIYKHNINWEDIYKDFINIKLLSIIPRNEKHHYYNHFHDYVSDYNGMLSHNNYISEQNIITNGGHCSLLLVRSQKEQHTSIKPSEFDYGESYKRCGTAWFEFAYINPDTGNLSQSFTHEIPLFESSFQILDVYLFIDNTDLVIQQEYSDLPDYRHSLPDKIKQYIPLCEQSKLDTYTHNQKGYDFLSGISIKTSPINNIVSFYMPIINTEFYFSLLSNKFTTSMKQYWYPSIGSYSIIKRYEMGNRNKLFYIENYGYISLEVIHILPIKVYGDFYNKYSIEITENITNNFFLVFKSEINPDIFNYILNIKGEYPIEI